MLKVINKTVKKILMGLAYAFLMIWVVVEIYPIIYMFISSLKTDAEVMYNPWALPKRLNFDNYVTVWKGGSININFGNYFINSIIVTTISLALLSFAALLCGYALARYDFPGNKAVYKFVVGLLAIPVHALLVPVYMFIEDLKLLNNFLGVILVYSTFWLPFSIIIMRSYFESIPKETEEAARIEGCSEFGVFFLVGVPISKGAIATLIIVNVVGIWSELMFSSVLLMDPEVRTLPLGVMMFKSGMYNSSIANLMAALSIATIPLLIVYFIFQKQIVKGMTIGAIK